MLDFVFWRRKHTEKANPMSLLYIWFLIHFVYSLVWRGDIIGLKISFTKWTNSRKIVSYNCIQYIQYTKCLADAFVFSDLFVWYSMLCPLVNNIFQRFILFQVLSGEEVGSEAPGASTVFSGCSRHCRGTLLYGGLSWAILYGLLWKPSMGARTYSPPIFIAPALLLFWARRANGCVFNWNIELLPCKESPEINFTTDSSVKHFKMWYSV